MRHAKVSRKFGRDMSQRKSLFRNLVTALLKHGKIETTLPKAKELRVWADQMITLGKRGDLHARRLAAAIIEEPKVVQRLFADIAPVMKDRPGGYTRITHLGPRLGDAAPMAMIELVAQPERKKPEKPAAKEKKTVKKAAKPKAAKKPAADKADKKAKPAKKAAKAKKE